MLIICGIINLWGNFVANEHLNFVIPLHRYSCVLWSFWIIFISLSGWFTFMFMRLLYRSYQLHPAFKNLSEEKKKIICNWVLLLIATPIFSICFYATYNNSSIFDPEKQSCTTESTAKIMVLTWLVTCGLALVVTSIVLERGIRSMWLTEYKSHRKIIAVAIFITLVNICINIFGLQRYMIGRCIFTSLVALLHFYCIAKLLVYKIYKCINRDEDYSKRYAQSILAVDANMYSIKELSNSSAIMDEFMQYCINMGTRTIESRAPTKEGEIKLRNHKILSPTLMKQMYNEMTKWKTTFYHNDTLRQVELIHIMRYMDPDQNYPEKKAKLPSGYIVSSDIFDEVIDDILEDYQQGWGQEYLTKFNRNNNYYETKTSFQFVASNI